MDKFTSMRVFIATIEEGSFAAAARRFHLSAAMAGKHVSAIESDLNVRLIQRSTRRLSLTDAGQRYYERCKTIIEALEEAEKEASDTQATPHGLLRIAAPVAFGAMYLGPIVSRYLEAYPNVSVDVVLEDKYSDLLENRVDVALRIGRLDDPTLVTRRLAPCRMVLCASPDYLKKHGRPETPDDLSRAPRLVFSQAVSAGDWTLYDAENTLHVIDSRSRLTANNMQLLREAALTGAGIAYGPSFVFREPILQGQLVELLPEYRTSELTIQAVYPSAIRIPFKVRTFVDFIADALNSAPF